MKFELRLREVARSDVADAHRYYRKISERLADDFLAAVEEGLSLIRESPERYSMMLGEIRVKRIRRFPYIISFVIEDDVVIVLAVLHGHRNPSQWSGRNR